MDFQSFAELWKSTLSENLNLPIDLTKPSAFLETLDAFGIDKSYLWHHVSCGFFIKASKQICAEFFRFCTCKCVRWPGFIDDLLLVSGDIYTLWQLVIVLCSDNKQVSIRYIGNCLFLLLQRGGFKPIFNRYTKAPLNDGTFILRSK